MNYLRGYIHGLAVEITSRSEITNVITCLTEGASETRLFNIESIMPLSLSFNRSLKLHCFGTMLLFTT